MRMVALCVGLLLTVGLVPPARADLLELIVRDTPKPNYGAPVPAEISGRVLVRADDPVSGAPGVAVTDGFSVVKTDRTGAYTLRPEPRAVFVYVTRPSGYNVEGAWYKPLAAKVDFTLTPAADDESEYTFVHVTDTHISTDPVSLEGLSCLVREINALDPPPRFVVNSGDLVNLSKTLSNPPETGHAYFRNYAGIMNHLAMPCYNVAGDHTDSSYRLDMFPRGDIRCGKAMYWEYLGPHFFSFEYGRIHFVSVDFGYHLGKNQIKGSEYPTNEVQPVHVEWIKQDMANRTAGTFVVTTSESDLARHCPGFVDMARQHDVRLQLTGDDHVVAHEARFVPYRTGGSLSGCWWNPECNRLCHDLSPAGYLVYQVRGEELACFYKGLGERLSIVSHRTGAPWQAAVLVQAHVVQPVRDEVLEYSVNGSNWSPMQETGRPFYRAAYEVPVDTAVLPDGFADLRVRSSATGEICSRRVVVANGVSPAPFEGDAVLRFTVGRVSHGPARAPAGKVDVLFNGVLAGVLEAGVSTDYALAISGGLLKKANTVRFRFAEPGDGMALTSPALACRGKIYRDPRDAAVEAVRVAQWGTGSAGWGGFITGDGGLEEGPFRRRQDVFCFVVETGEEE